MKSNRGHGGSCLREMRKKNRLGGVRVPPGFRTRDSPTPAWPVRTAAAVRTQSTVATEIIGPLAPQLTRIIHPQLGLLAFWKDLC